ncbi:short chain dehydrogenase [compost metagenome]
MRNLSATMTGRQPGDPEKGAQVILAAVYAHDAPLRLPLGPDAHRNIRAKLASVESDLAAWSSLTTATSFEE